MTIEAKVPARKFWTPTKLSEGIADEETARRIFLEEPAAAGGYFEVTAAVFDRAHGEMTPLARIEDGFAMAERRTDEITTAFFHFDSYDRFFAATIRAPFSMDPDTERDAAERALRNMRNGLSILVALDALGAEVDDA